MTVSLTALRAFEAAARHLSFKMAAEELNLTPTAISHQVRGLEAMLSRKLFHRQTRRIVLTTEGGELARAVGPAFQAIDLAVERLTAGEPRRIVTLGAGPVFASRWLAPRLGRFWRRHPDIDLRLHHSPLPVHQQMARFDLAVAWGDGQSRDGQWRDGGGGGELGDLILRVRATPVHAPGASFLRGSLTDPADLLDMPLLHHRDRDGWRQWLQAAGVEGVDPSLSELPGAVFDDANVVLQAALEGQGVALGLLPLIDDEVAVGRLIRPWTLAAEPAAAYYLMQGRSDVAREAVRDTRDWLLSEAGSAVARSA